MKEVWGLQYERFSLAEKQKKIAKKYSIKKVLEIPAYGEKAMPGIYSLGFAQAGCEVTVVNASQKTKKAWKQAGLKAEFINEKDLTKTKLQSESFDLVWNFAYLPMFERKHQLLQEMRRLSKKYVGVFAINGYNYGQPVHKFLHWWHKIEWTHGEKKLMFAGNMKKLMKKNAITIEKTGVVDVVPWPDSPGFRDIRLHKLGKDFSDADWEVPIIKYMKNGYPNWVKLVWVFENIPMFLPVKMLYSHIYYVIGKK